MKEFNVLGPFDVPVKIHNISKVKMLDIDLLKDFWLENQLGSEKGIYVFSKRASTGFVPLYIGKTIKQSFTKEVFNPRNVNMLNGLFHDFPKGTLVLFLLSYPEKKKVIGSVIDEVETTMIQYGLKANPNLLNDRKTKISDTWGIKGVVRCGHPSNASKKFKRCFNI